MTHKHVSMPTKPQGTCSTLWTALTASLILSACGGGSDTINANTAPIITAAPTSSLVQGRWASTGLSPAYTAVVVPAPTGVNTPAVDTLWALAQDATTLIKLKANGPVQTAGALTGSVYTLGTSSVTAVSGASYTIQASATGQQVSIQPLLSTTALFDRTDAMSMALTASQANGKWQADLGTVKVNWSVQSAATGTNNLSGTSTSGCTYSGRSTVVATQSLYRVEFTETCPGSGTLSIQNFNGIGTLAPDNTRLTVVAANETETRAAALLFVKQP
jgi:hypothetical protein